jgi:hypothetical protein
MGRAVWNPAELFIPARERQHEAAAVGRRRAAPLPSGPGVKRMASSGQIDEATVETEP